MAQEYLLILTYPKVCKQTKHGRQLRAQYDQVKEIVTRKKKLNRNEWITSGRGHSPTNTNGDREESAT